MRSPVNGLLRRGEGRPDLEALTGVRSGKQTYYREYQRSNERLERTLSAMDTLSHALVRTAEGPRTLIDEVVRVAAEHLQSSMTVIALRNRALPGARPRFVAVDAFGRVLDKLDHLPPDARREVALLRSGDTAAPEWDGAGWVRVRMTLDGSPVGGLVALPGLDDVEAADLAVLRILANQAAVSMHTSHLYEASLRQQRRAQQLLDEVELQAHVIAGRTEELRAAEQRLRVADQRELMDGERRRIALELHDSVAQTVLVAGLSVDVLRGVAAALPGGTDLAGDLDATRQLMATATEQLRSIIYALHHTRASDGVATLPELLAEMAAQHRPTLPVNVRIEGRPVPLGTATEHALARTAGEALFNVVLHAGATRAQVRLRYLPDQVVLRVSDDGGGDPVALRRTIKMARQGTADGRHRGLVGMALRAEGLDGTLTVRRSRSGGVAIESRIPVARPTPPYADTEGDQPCP